MFSKDNKHHRLPLYPSKQTQVVISPSVTQLPWIQVVLLQDDISLSHSSPSYNGSQVQVKVKSPSVFVQVPCMQGLLAQGFSISQLAAMKRRAGLR